MKAFDEGADGVLVFACPEDQCHYIDGSKKAEERIRYMKKTLDVLGIGSERMEVFHINSCEPDRFANLATQFSDKIAMNHIEVKEIDIEK
jgi:F420-non-reducing hydrogenase iron-sulfur subunit